MWYAQQADREAHPREVSVYVVWQKSQRLQLLEDDCDGNKLKYTHENEGETVSRARPSIRLRDLESLSIRLNARRGLALSDRHASTSIRHQ